MSDSTPSQTGMGGRRGPNLARPISQIFLEALLVALGVVLALAANEWRQSTLANETAGEALQSIQEELIFNRAQFDSATVYHSTMADSLREYMRQGRTPTAGMFYKGFIWPAAVQTTAWDTARETDALHPLPYARILEISRVYTSLESYRTQSRTSGEVIYQTLFREGTAGIVSKPANLLTIIYTFLYKEAKLREEFDRFLAEWDQLDQSSRGPRE